MNKQQINRTVGRIVVVLSFAALLAVLSGYAQPSQRDEGTAAHIFQLSIMGLVPMLSVFLMTADWKRPWRSLRPLALSSAALVVAFGALYYLEHYRTKSGKNVGLLNVNWHQSPGFTDISKNAEPREFDATPVLKS